MRIEAIFYSLISHFYNNESESIYQLSSKHIQALIDEQVSLDETLDRAHFIHNTNVHPFDYPIDKIELLNYIDESWNSSRLYNNYKQDIIWYFFPSISNRYCYFIINQPLFLMEEVGSVVKPVIQLIWEDNMCKFNNLFTVQLPNNTIEEEIYLVQFGFRATITQAVVLYNLRNKGKGYKLANSDDENDPFSVNLFWGEDSEITDDEGSIDEFNIELPLPGPMKYRVYEASDCGTNSSLEEYLKDVTSNFELSEVDSIDSELEARVSSNNNILLDEDSELSNSTFTNIIGIKKEMKIKDNLSDNTLPLNNNNNNNVIEGNNAQGGMERRQSSYNSTEEAGSNPSHQNSPNPFVSPQSPIKFMKLPHRTRIDTVSNHLKTIQYDHSNGTVIGNHEEHYTTILRVHNIDSYIGDGNIIYGYNDFIATEDGNVNYVKNKGQPMFHNNSNNNDNNNNNKEDKSDEFYYYEVNDNEQSINNDKDNNENNCNNEDDESGDHYSSNEDGNSSNFNDNENVDEDDVSDRDISNHNSYDDNQSISEENSDFTKEPIKNEDNSSNENEGKDKRSSSEDEESEGFYDTTSMFSIDLDNEDVTDFISEDQNEIQEVSTSEAIDKKVELCNIVISQELKEAEIEPTPSTETTPNLVNNILSPVSSIENLRPTTGLSSHLKELLRAAFNFGKIIGVDKQSFLELAKRITEE